MQNLHYCYYWILQHPQLLTDWDTVCKVMEVKLCTTEKTKKSMLYPNCIFPHSTVLWNLCENWSLADSSSPFKKRKKSRFSEDIKNEFSFGHVNHMYLYLCTEILCKNSSTDFLSLWGLLLQPWSVLSIYQSVTQIWSFKGIAVVV